LKVYVDSSFVVQSRSMGKGFSFEVGKSERHLVHFSFDRLLGGLKVTVDGVPTIRDLRTVSLSLVKEYQFRVGANEVHEVSIRKERKLIFAGFRPHICRVFVDGVEIGVYSV